MKNRKNHQNHYYANDKILMDRGDVAVTLSNNCWYLIDKTDHSHPCSSLAYSGAAVRDDSVDLESWVDKKFKSMLKTCDRTEERLLAELEFCRKSRKHLQDLMASMEEEKP